MTIHQDPELVMTLQSVIEFIGTFAFASASACRQQAL